MHLDPDPDPTKPHYEILQAVHQAHFDRLYRQLAEPIRDHLSQQPYSVGAVNRVLNVLAVHSAYVLAGCDDPQSDRFFHACLNGTLQTAREELGQGEIAKQEPSG